MLLPRHLRNLLFEIGVFKVSRVRTLVLGDSAGEEGGLVAGSPFDNPNLARTKYGGASRSCLSRTSPAPV